MLLVVATVLPWLFVAIGIWIGFQLVHQNGRILLRLGAIEQQVGRRTAAPQRESRGLPVGSMAPEFELPDLAGAHRTLSAFRGRDLLLIFFNPQCGFCTKMAVDLAALPIDGRDGRPLPIVISTGDAEANRKLVEQNGVRGIYLLQKQMEVATQYHAQGTPMGYRIDKSGRIASELTVGGEPLLKLFATNGKRPHAAGEDHAHAAAHGKQPDPSLARSRLNRSGLKAGTAAPDFTLPRIDGGELSLRDLRGERVLLVFSDPECGPCDELAPRLEELHAERSEMRVLMISRRNAEATRVKAEELGLSFPIVVQKQWEVSMQYGMFATPIGYLIDEQGVLLSDVAVGMEPILALTARDSSTETNDAAASLKTVLAS